MPNLYAPQSLDRYAYVLNNPLRYNDPTGHMCSDPENPTPSCDGSGNTKVGNIIVAGKHVSGAANTKTGQSSGALEDSLSHETTQVTQIIPIDPTQKQFVGEPPPPVSTTRLVVGTVLFGVLLIAGVVTIVAGFGVSTHDPLGVAVIAFGAVVAAFAVEGLYQIWRPLLPSTWPKNLIVEGFNIP